MAAGGRLVGIDLGTTNSVLAYLDAGGVPTSLVNGDGQVTLPSKLVIAGGQVQVGTKAAQAGLAQADDFAELFKRYMGEDAFPPTVASHSWRPEMLSAFVLKRLAQDAQKRLGSVGPAVITVPAYFDDVRRRATYSAAAIAGWEVLDLINEPTAAALAYAHKVGKRAGQTAAQPADKNTGQEHVLVFDLGGGTLDATVLAIDHGREYRTVATDGEVELGGYDWDCRLRDHLAEQFHKQTGRDPLVTRQGQHNFLQLAEKAKRTLSDKDAAQLTATFDGQQASLKVERKTFETLTADLVQRCRGLAELVLEQAGKNSARINTVLAVGGSTRMPMIRRMLQQLWGKPPDQSLSVDEAVAHGAVLYAHLKSGKNPVRVINVNSHSYRVLARRPGGETFAKGMITKNSPLPAAATHVFSASAGGGARKIEVYEGEEDDPQYCIRIGKVVVDELGLAGDKTWLVQVKIVCREDGNLDVAAAVRDPDDTSKIVKHLVATLEPAHGMTSQQVADAQRELAGLKVV